MMWKRLMAMCVVSVSSVALTTTAAHADAPLVVKVPLVLSSSAQSDIAGCVGETVTVTGGQFNVVRAPDVFMSHRNIINGLAVGNLTDSVYRLSGHRQVIDHLIGASGQTFTFIVQLSATSATASFRAQGREHVTFTPTGDLASYTSNFSINCT